jgi:hypothetical protein
MDEHIVHPGTFTRFGGEAPVEAGGLEGHDEMGQAMRLDEGLSFRKEPVDLVSTAVEAPTPQNLAIVRERSGLTFPSQINA